MKEFAQGQKIRTASGGELKIISELGRGGQGIVYKVDYKGRELALKWYFDMRDPDRFYQNLQNNIKKGAPTETFLWPMELTEYVDGSFGYVMELRPPQYKDFSLFLLAKVRFSSIEAVLNAALQITNGFRALHNSGFSYQDLNDGNFFVNPATGDVLICDNDNVAEYGDNLGIAGKCRYMAPEIVMRKEMPSEHTDRFSLAVVLYRLLFMDHPLEGKKTLVPCMTEKHEWEFYGSDPVFVWDSANDTNRPVRGVHQNEIRIWPAYPKLLHDAFAEALSHEAMVGKDVKHRMMEKRWQEVFTALRDCKVKCSCGGETFIDVDQEVSRCINCGKEVRRPLILKVKKYKVVLWTGKKLYECHVKSDSDDFKSVRGELITRKDDPTALGVRNLSDYSWTAILPNGATKAFSPGEVIRLGRGMKINFGGGNEGKII